MSNNMDIKELQLLAQKIESGQQLTDEEQAKVQEFVDHMWEALQPVIAAICDAVAPLCDTITEAFCLINSAARELLTPLADPGPSWETLGLLNCPNRRVAHLAFYGKTERIRLKNFRRAIRLSEEVNT